MQLWYLCSIKFLSLSIFLTKDRNKLLKVKGIIWTILPNVRKDALLTSQANLINMFKVGVINLLTLIIIETLLLSLG